MKNFFHTLAMAAFCLTFSAFIPAFAQDDGGGTDQDDEFLNGFDYENAEQAGGLKPYRILGIGYNANFLLNDLDDFNKLVNSKLGMDDIKTPMFLNSYDFIFSLAPMKNFYFGISRAIGSKSVDKQMTGDLANYKRYLKYGISFTDFELGWSYVPVKRLAIQPAVNIGLTNLNIENYQTVKSIEYNDFFSNSDVNQYYHKMNAYFFTLEPHLGIQYKLAANFMIRGTAGYRINMSPDWKLNYETDIKNAPDGHKPNGFTARVGLYIGIIDF